MREFYCCGTAVSVLLNLDKDRWEDAKTILEWWGGFAETANVIFFFFFLFFSGWDRKQKNTSECLSSHEDSARKNFHRIGAALPCYQCDFSNPELSETKKSYICNTYMYFHAPKSSMLSRTGLVMVCFLMDGAGFAKARAGDAVDRHPGQST